MYDLSALPFLATVAPDRRRRRYNVGMLPTVNTAARGNFDCPQCQKTYKWYRGLHRHLKYECGKAPRFKCPHCMYTGKHRSHVYSHIKSNHGNRPIYALDTQQSASSSSSSVVSLRQYSRCPITEPYESNAVDTQHSSEEPV